METRTKPSNQYLFTRTQLLNPVTAPIFLRRQRRTLHTIVHNPGEITPPPLTELCQAGHHTTARNELLDELTNLWSSVSTEACIDALRSILVLHTPDEGHVLWYLLGACHHERGEYREAEEMWANASNIAAP